jgi:hypothetical protein
MGDSAESRYASGQNYCLQHRLRCAHCSVLLKRSYNTPYIEHTCGHHKLQLLHERHLGVLDGSISI